MQQEEKKHTHIHTSCSKKIKKWKVEEEEIKIGGSSLFSIVFCFFCFCCFLETKSPEKLVRKERRKKKRKKSNLVCVPLCVCVSK